MAKKHISEYADPGARGGTADPGARGGTDDPGVEGVQLTLV
jgi:hypothetical protein